MADLDCGQRWGTCTACAQEGCSQLQPVVSCSGPSDCPDPAVNQCDGGAAVWSVGVYLVPGARLYLNGHTIRRAQVGILGGRPDGTAGTARVRIVGPGAVASTREAARFYNGSLDHGVALSDSLYGVAASKVRLEDVDASGNSVGVSAFDSLRATRLVADDNRVVGILSYASARIVDSHATGNAEVDIASELPPRVRTTTCDHSAALEETGTPGLYEPDGPPWGVCSGD
jgi:hypothetical protein